MRSLDNARQRNRRKGCGDTPHFNGIVGKYGERRESSRRNTGSEKEEAREMGREGQREREREQED